MNIEHWYTFFLYQVKNSMLRNDTFAIGFLTIYLVIYIILLQFDSTWTYGFVLLLFSPVLLGWMVYTILKHGKYSGPDLGADEFGYQDKRKDELGPF